MLIAAYDIRGRAAWAMAHKRLALCLALEKHNPLATHAVVAGNVPDGVHYLYLDQGPPLRVLGSLPWLMS
jgi:hypothetical protein